jgi:hypothetical protein
MAVKYPLEYVFDNDGVHATSGENVRNNKIVDDILITKHKRTGFVEEVDNGTAGSGPMPINWNKGNYQRFNTRTDGDGQWVSFSNPGSAGRYQLVIKKSVGSHEVLAFGDGTNLYTNIDWPYGYVQYGGMDLNSIMFITFIWDGSRYTAIPLNDPEVTKVVVAPGFTIKISLPSTFSPTGSNTWNAINLGSKYSTNSMKIFEYKGGPVIYQTTYYHNNPWNGKPWVGMNVKNVWTLSTQLVPAGIYYYILYDNLNYNGKTIRKNPEQVGEYILTHGNFFVER